MSTAPPPTSLSTLCDKLGYSDADGFYWLSESNVTIPQQMSGVDAKLGVDAVYGTQRGTNGVFSPLVYFVDMSNQSRSVAEIYNNVWNEGLANLLIVLTADQLKIYNTTQRPVNLNHGSIDEQNRLFETLDLVKKSLEDAHVSEISHLNLASGEFWKQHKAAFDTESRVDQHLQRNLEKLRSKLTEDLPLEYANNLIIRSLFILSLTDRGIIKKSDFQQSFSVDDYRELLTDSEETYTFFSMAKSRLNGDIFDYEEAELEAVTSEHLEYIRRFLNGTDLETNQARLFPYKFDLVPIELISSIYEQFVASSDSGGTYYTRPDLVNYMFDVHLQDPINNFRSIMDPACGSGIFLVSAFTRIVSERKEAGDDLTPADLKEILTNQLYGYDTNSDAIQITSFSLSLKLLEYVSEIEIWEGDFELPTLIGESLECRDFFTLPNEGRFDLVVGNPPWGSLNEIESTAPKYLEAADYPVNNNNAAQAFIWKAWDVLEEDGEAVLAIPCQQVLLNTQVTEFQQAFFGTVEIRGISNLSLLRHALFENSDSPAAVLEFGASPRQEQSSIRYITPKPAGSSTLRTIPIDMKADVKHLGREYTNHPSVWKTAMYGGGADLNLVRKLEQIHPSLGEIAADRGWLIGKGFEDTSKESERKHAPDVAGLPHLSTRDIKPYATQHKSLIEYDGDEYFKHPRKQELYEPPFIAVRDSITIRQGKPGAPRGIKASFQLEAASFTSTVDGISGPEGDTELLKLTTLLLNSSLTHYWLFMTTVTWGVGRTQLRQEEIKSIPFPVDLFEEHKQELLNKYEEIQQLVQAGDRGKRYQEVVSEVDDILFNCLNLSDTEQGLIESHVSQTIEYFHKRDRSSALDPVRQGELEAYGTVVCSEINSYLEHVPQQLRPMTYDFEITDFPLKLLTLELGDSISTNYSQDGSKRIREKLGSIESNDDLFDQRTIEIFDEGAIHLIKPNERRYWSRAQAANDSLELVGELIDRA